MPFVRIGGLVPARPIMTPLFNENVYIGVNSSMIGGREQAAQEFVYDWRTGGRNSQHF